jgi:hypothetical protein
VKHQPADITATVNFIPTDAGGRRGPTPGGKFNCLMVIDENNFDVRLHLEGTGPISPGQTARVPISFLDLEQAKKYCSVGKTFILREVRPIGRGVIEEIAFFDHAEVSHRQPF